MSKDEVSAVVEHSAVVEVLEEDEISSDGWNPAHFGETPRQVDANGNPTIFWDESIEPPEPDDFESLQEYEEAWQKWEENSDNSIYAAELGQASPSAESSQENSKYADCAKSTPGVKKDCAIASQMSQSTRMSGNSQKSQESTSSPHRHYGNLLPLKESAWVEQIHEIVSPQYCDSLTESNPNSSVLKTSPEWLEQEFGLPIGWTSPQECRAATELLERVEQPSEISSTPELQPSQSNEYSTSTPCASVKEQSGEYSITKSSTVKAISLWQPWASLISLGLKHYETRSWETKYRGKLLICSTAKSTKTQYLHYLKICNEVELPFWDEDNFPHGCAIAICDLVDCIEMTPEFIAQQSQTEILCGNWQVGRYAWKLENIQPVAESFAIKGKQGLFNIPSTNFESDLKKQFTLTQESKKDNKKSDCWYTPLHIINLVVQVLGAIDLDPCADDGKHITAAQHYTFNDDGLNKPWYGRVYINPPYSCPGVWMKKLQADFESGKVKEAIALVPAATDTKWLSPVLKTQSVCFWKGRIKFLGEDYQPKRAARQSHVLVYWGENWQRFKGVFEEYGFVSVPSQFLEDKLSENISSRKTEEPKFLEDKLSENISSRKTDEPKFLEDKLSENISSRKTDEPKFLEDKSDDNISSRKTRRCKGDGSGCIYYRTVTKKGKEYHEAYYQYEVWKDGDRLVKSSKYIQKRLLSQVQQMESEKAPVKEILKLLGVVE